jgi:hypothetical protein
MHAARALIAGVAGTAVMTMLMLGAPLMGLPRMPIGEMLGGFLRIGSTLGWAMHGAIGLMLAGLYAALSSQWLPGPAVLRGVVFGILVFLVAQLAVMPLMGAGVFSGGDGALIMGSLLGHLVFGGVVGALYRVPVPAPLAVASFQASRVAGLVLVAAVAAAGAALTSPHHAWSSTLQAHGPDTTGAALWAHLERSKYREAWALWPGKGRLYAGREPHGMLLTTYLNPVAQRALADRAGQMPPGAIIVKENYMPDSTLAAVTVMYKVRGYNAKHNDWFFTKHLPGGKLDAMNGMALEGRVPGCQDCHGAQKTNDYIFTGALRGN